MAMFPSLSKYKSVLYGAKGEHWRLPEMLAWAALSVFICILDYLYGGTFLSGICIHLHDSFSSRSLPSSWAVRRYLSQVGSAYSSSSSSSWPSHVCKSRQPYHQRRHHSRSSSRVDGLSIFTSLFLAVTKTMMRACVTRDAHLLRVLLSSRASSFHAPICTACALTASCATIPELD